MDSKPIFDEIFQRVSKGNIISPRGSKVIEVENFMYELPPYVKFQNYDVRKLKFNYIKQELLWYLRHNVHDTSIVNFASIWKDLIQPIYDANKLSGKATTGDLNSAFEISQTSL
jgi:hypothetical protein